MNQKYFEGLSAADRLVLVETKPYLKDLTGVGTRKPMGYLPIPTLQSYGIDLEEMAVSLVERGLTITVTSQEEGHVGGGALYACDPGMLEALLDRNQETLGEHGWPTDAMSFMACVTHGPFVEEAENPAIYAIIGQAFNDPRFPTPKDLLRLSPDPMGA